MPLRHRVLAAKYSMGVVTMPTSMTWMPAATSPRASAPHSIGPLSRPSRPTATVLSPSRKAMVPNARPSASATASSTVEGTMPRMS